MSTEEQQQQEERAAKWIEEVCLDRLTGGSSGLAEPILMASLQKRSPEDIGPITSTDIRRVLKGLEAAGRVEHSAGRWKRKR